MTLILSGTDGLSDVDGTAATPALRGTDANTGIFFPAADTIAFAEGGAEAMRIDSSGNVGIGTASPSGAKVQIVGDNSALRVGSGTRDLYVDPDSGGVFVSNGASQTGEGHYLDASGNTLRMYTSTTERARIDSSGNVGIGTSSPTSRLHLVNSSASCTVIIDGQSAANKGATITFRKGGTDTAYIGQASAILGGGSTSNDLILYADGAVNQLFYTNGSERARIDSSGNLLVGATSSSGKITSSSASTSALSAIISSASQLTTVGLNIQKADNNSTTSNWFAAFTINSGATGSGLITANGASAAGFTSFSDSRLKENIVNLPSQLDNIMALRPVEFDYVESMGGGHQVGFIAQEVQAVFPDLVNADPNGMLTLTDMNKNDARLIKAIQELKAIVDAQGAEIAALKGATA